MTKYITPEEYERAAANGISRNTLEYRVRQRGWDKETAITQPPRKKMKHSREHKALARSNGIPESLYRQRIKQYGWTPQRAATEPAGHPESRKAAMAAARAAREKYPKELRDEALRRGISIKTFHSRVSKGWAPEEAARHPPLRRQTQ